MLCLHIVNQESVRLWFAILRNIIHYHDSVIIADVESPEHAPDPSFAAKRLALYRRIGAFVSDFEVELWGVRYKVIH